jgi:hypothetical protein
MTDTDQEVTERTWVIVRDGADFSQQDRFLSENQGWGTLENAMTFGTLLEAEGGSETLCPPFSTGHAEAVAPTSSR